jgi:hypothetical protein
MAQTEHILHLRNDEINRQFWDECLDRHFPDLLYMRSWYLDCMAPGWEALLVPDREGYQSIMALPLRSKWGIRYLYQPFLVAQCGIVGHGTSKESLFRFLQSIPSNIRYGHYDLNEQNVPVPDSFTMKDRKNRVLSLSVPFAEIRKAYHENTERNIRKAEKQGIRVVRKENVADIQRAIELFLQQPLNRKHGKERYRLQQLVYTALERKQVSQYVSVDEADNWLSSCIFLWQGHRAYYLLPANDPESRGTGASHALVNAFIQEHAGSDRLLDFEGSDIETVDRFYAGFGAEIRPYPSLHINRLPFYLRWLKS